MGGILSEPLAGRSQDLGFDKMISAVGAPPFRSSRNRCSVSMLSSTMDRWKYS